MSQVRYLADENLRRAFVDATLRLLPSLDFATVQELGLSAIADDDLLQFANDSGWIVVSHDVSTMKEFAEQRIRNGEGIAGLFLVPANRTVLPVAESLVLIFSASEAEEWRNRIVYLPL